MIHVYIVPNKYIHDTCIYIYIIPNKYLNMKGLEDDISCSNVDCLETETLVQIRRNRNMFSP